MTELVARRQHIPYGYRAFTSKILSVAAVDRYNVLQDEINTWIDAEREVPEHLLNESHRHMAMSAALNGGN